MKNVVIDSVQFLLTTRHWNDETIGAYLCLKMKPSMAIPNFRI